MKTLGWTGKKGTGLATISLNSEAILLVEIPGRPADVFETIWETILHEMCVSMLDLRNR